MPGDHIRVTEMYNFIGDDTSNCAKNIRRAGDDMFRAINDLIASEGLAGEGIARSLEASHQRWNVACDSFAMAEQRFAQQAYNHYVSMRAADNRGAGYMPNTYS